MTKTNHIPTIAVVNQKGGVGKSFLADELAFWCDRNDVPCELVELDPQGGMSHAPDDVEGARVRIIDTPGALRAELRDVLTEADAVVVPVRPSERGVTATERMLGLVEDVCEGAAGFLVVNCWNRFRTARSFRRHEDEWDARGWNVFHVPQAELVVQAEETRKSVVELNRRARVSVAVDELCGVVVGEVLA